MNVNPRIEKCSKTLVIGNKLLMSVAEDKTIQLWKIFMPKKERIGNRLGEEYYSIEVYSSIEYFKQFDPEKKFEKWAAVQVKDHGSVPDEMEALIIPEGRYAVFTYKGASGFAHTFYQYIFTQWLPNSAYQLDERPHFAMMGANYKNNDPNSEEEIWIPIC